MLYCHVPANTASNASSCLPVSYTHLDVYKRQPEGGTHVTGFRQALSRAVNDYARNAKLLKDTDSSLSRDELSEGPVSYTHLDVYKRQP